MKREQSGSEMRHTAGGRALLAARRERGVSDMGDDLMIAHIVGENFTECTKAAFNEFPRDLFGQKWRSRGFVVVHILVAFYMFYSLAIVCDLYFLPALGECSTVPFE